VDATTTLTLDELRRRFVLVDGVVKERDTYRRAYEAALLELERLKRGLFGQKAEKVDAAQVALFFEPFRKVLEAVESEAGDGDSPPDPPPSKRKPHGRRKLSDANLPEEILRIEPPPELRTGKLLGVDVSYRIEYRRGGRVRVRMERARYTTEVSDEQSARTGSKTTVIIAELPPEMIPKCIAAPGMLAHVLALKFAYHVPFNRQEKMHSCEGFKIDRATMCRWAEGCHEKARLVVEAMRKEAIETAFVIGTDATGVLVQNPEQCKRGHFFVSIADRDHVFFDYRARHDSSAPKELFKGFQGYLQADASSVYDALFRERDGPTEVGCWSHARRNFFHAVRSDRRSLIAIGFIGKLFEVDRGLGKLPTSERTHVRRMRAGPILDGLRKWKDTSLADSEIDPRSAFARALRYLDRHWIALTRFTEDARIRLDNNLSELELRHLVVGRKNWLFVGSDESAAATCTFVSLIASATLHGLDPEEYLRDLFRVLPQWPEDRVIELAPKYWSRTRERLDPKELDAILGWLTIPAPLPSVVAADPG
jgi:transposase